MRSSINSPYAFITLLFKYGSKENTRERERERRKELLLIVNEIDEKLFFVFLFNSFLDLFHVFLFLIQHKKRHCRKVYVIYI